MPGWRETFEKIADVTESPINPINFGSIFTKKVVQKSTIFVSCLRRQMPRATGPEELNGRIV